MCDVYAKKRGGLGGKKTGTPILYYRARTQYVEQNLNTGTPTAIAPPTGWTEADNDIYFYLDNSSIIDLGMPDDGVDYTLAGASVAEGQENFQEMIVNEQVQNVLKPYRADSFILISAGFDAPRDEPLVDLNLASSSFYSLTRIVTGFADLYAEKRIVSTLEGGYNFDVLGDSAANHVRALTEA